MRGQGLQFCRTLFHTAMNRRATVLAPHKWGLKVGFSRRRSVARVLHARAQKRNSYPWAVYNAGEDACTTIHQQQQRDRLLCSQRSATGAAHAGCAAIAVGVNEDMSASQKVD